MRLTGWHVEGFGILSAYEVRDLPGGLVVFGGPNEAGKSTLLAFLRGVLFGFPRAVRGRGPAYPPLRGGRHGGRIFLETDAGPITIEREVGRGSRITLANDTHLSDGDFQRLVGGVDAQTFRTVFAFSLDELRDFDSLTAEQVRSRIFAAGLGGTGRSIRQVTQDLEKTTGRLLKRRSGDGEINALLAALSVQERDLTEPRLRADRYPDLLAEEQAVAARLTELSQVERATRAELSWHERLLELWPTWVELENDRTALGALAPVEDFVADPVRRLAEAKQAVAGAAQNLVRIENQLHRRSAEMSELETECSEALWAITAAVEEQKGLLPSYRDRRRECGMLQERIRLEEGRLAAVVRELGSDLDEAGLLDIDTSLPRIEQVREWRSRLDEAVERAKQATERLENAALLAKRAKTERDRQQETLDAMSIPDEAALAAQAGAVRVLRAGLSDLLAKEATLEGREAALGAVATLVDPGAAPTGARSRWGVPLIVALSLGVVLAVAAIVSLIAKWSFLLGGTSELALAVPLALSAVVVFFAAWILVVSARSRHGDSSSPAVAVRFMEEERFEHERLRHEIEQARAALADAAGLLGLCEAPNPEELERIDALVEERKQAAAGWNNQRSRLTEMEELARSTADDAEVARDVLGQAEEIRRSLEHDFALRLGEWGLPATLSGPSAEEYLRAVAAAKDVKYRLDGDRAALVGIEGEIAGWESRTGRLLEEGGMSDSSSLHQELETGLLTLTDLCAEESQRRERLSSVRKAVAELEVEGGHLRSESEAASQQLAALLAQAAVDDEESFLERLQVFQARQELKRRVAEAEEQLTKRAGRGPEVEAFLGTLRGGDVPGWEERLDESRVKLDELQDARDEAVKLQGDIERRREELELSSDVPGLETAVAGLRTDLDEAVRRWRVNTLAADLVRRTLTKFTRERQPLVLAEASRMFALVTGGRYVRVIQAADEEGVIVVDAVGGEKTSEQLSRGTAEQLYLCLRLGLAEEFSRRSEPIPLVMDDVLVNFDRDRRHAMTRLLLEFAERHQVLFFTCHPEIEELIRSVQPQTRVVSLSS